MKKIVTILCLTLCSIGLSLHAQFSYTSVQYSMGFSTGDLGEFISAASFRGALIEYRRNFANDNLYAGIDVGWNTFYEALDQDVYTFESLSISDTCRISLRVLTGRFGISFRILSTYFLVSELI